MSQLILPRRSFLVGLGSLLAAPAVVKAERLMKVGNINHILYPMRGVIDYGPTADNIVVRVDRANFILKNPKPGQVFKLLNEKEIYQFFDKETLERLIPSHETDRRIQNHITKALRQHVAEDHTNFKL